MNLYIDPTTRRIAYMTSGLETPSFAMLVEGGRKTLFTPETLLKVEYSGTIPPALNVQTGWAFQLSLEGQIVAV